MLENLKERVCAANLTRLARNANTTPAELARLNGVDEKELAKLKVGQTIKLPVVD